MAEVFVILYRPVIDFMRGWEGDIGRSVSRLCNQIAATQRLLAPVKTGRLVASIRVGRHGRWGGGIATAVGANPSSGSPVIGVAMWQEEGTRPHIIRARPDNPTGHMTFFWPKVGHVVHFRQVSHPGNPATHWAKRGMEIGMAAWR